MVICSFTEIDNTWNEQELADKLMLLTDDQQQATLRKRQWMDKQLTIAGKLLLLKVLKKLRFEKNLSLVDIKYSEYKRPYFDAPMDFNIAHSGNIAMCCGMLLGELGIDIEEVKPIDLKDYTDYFTPNEWKHINNAADSQEAFYYYWTRKEAIIKAIGTGFHTPLSSVDVSGDSLVYDDVTYHLYPLKIKEGYQCHIACTVEIDDLRLMKVNL